MFEVAQAKGLAKSRDDIRKLPPEQQKDIQREAAARIAAGWKVFDRYYIGPEVQGFAAGDNYRQLRAGLHVTGLRTAQLEWSGGLGWARDSDNRDGLYGRVGLLMRR